MGSAVRHQESRERARTEKSLGRSKEGIDKKEEMDDWAFYLYIGHSSGFGAPD